MSRLAFVSPLPPASTGIADYSADVLAALSRHEIDAFHAQEGVDSLRAVEQLLEKKVPAEEKIALRSHRPGERRAHRSPR